MNRSRYQVEPYYNRDLSLHKPGVIPYSSRIVSPITSNRHKYELKQTISTNKSIEYWFSNHSLDERRVVYSFLDTLKKVDETNENKRRRQKSPNPRIINRINSAKSYLSQRELSQNSQNNNSRPLTRDIGQVLQTLERFRSQSSVQEKSVQTTLNETSNSLSVVNEIKSKLNNQNRLTTSISKDSNDNTLVKDNKSVRHYFSSTWRVTNPCEDIQQIIRPNNNISSFFNHTKKTYPEYYFIHPDWY